MAGKAAANSHWPSKGRYTRRSVSGVRARAVLPLAPHTAISHHVSGISVPKDNHEQIRGRQYHSCFGLYVMAVPDTHNAFPVSLAVDSVKKELDYKHQNLDWSSCTGPDYHLK